MTGTRVAVVQAEIVLDLAAGIERTSALAEEAARGGASLVVFPETWLPGYPTWLDVCRDVALWDHAPVKRVYARMAENAVVVDGVSGTKLGEIARATGVTMVIGVTERVDAGVGRGTLYNAMLTFGPDGTLLNHHRKLVPTYTERMVWGPGDAAGLRAVATPAGRVGGLICWEHWMPLARQAMHESGEDIHVAAWPTVHEMHQVASRQYAFEGRCFVLAGGSLMRASALPPELEPHPGRSRRPINGCCAAAARSSRRMVRTSPVPCTRSRHPVRRLDLSPVREEPMTLDVTGHYHRPDVSSSWLRGAAGEAFGVRAADSDGVCRVLREPHSRFRADAPKRELVRCAPCCPKGRHAVRRGGERRDGPRRAFGPRCGRPRDRVDHAYVHQRGPTPDGLSELHIARTLAGRKAAILKRADFAAVLPGGVGTLDELFEVLALVETGSASNSLRLVLNAEGFYAPVLDQLREGERAGLVNPATARRLIVETRPAILIDRLLARGQRATRMSARNGRWSQTSCFLLTARLMRRLVVRVRQPRSWT